jgi:hypothetical protein
MQARRVSHSLVATAVALAAGAALALAAPLAPTSVPLAGSSFQGGDGNQATEGGLTDWDALQAAGRVGHNHDDNAEDTQFAGGTKEGDPAHWTFNTKPGGVTPGKANILDAWSAVDQPAGKTFLYLAFTRNAGTGDTFLTFELNRDHRLWTNDEGVKVPCRREGDMLVSYEISGNRPEVFLRRWHTLTTDADTGCARTGSIESSTAVTASAAQGAINPAAIANHLPGFFGATIPGAQFGEAALDLDALLGPVFGGGCYAFGSIWMHSRSSTSYTSQMQDYVAPKPIDLRTCAASGTKFFDLDADGVRDDGEPGIPGFEIFADYNGNGRLDPGEPSTVSDSSGRYVLDDIRPPNGRGYTLRERLPLSRRRATNDWVCSFPNQGTDGGFGPGIGLRCGWGPIDSATEPYARGRDFGNWYPAQLTVRKELAPASDPGRFDLLVNGQVVVGNAQDGSSATLDVPPGFYTVSEGAVAGTDPSLYASSVQCKLLTRRARTRAGTNYSGVALPAGGRATCTFRNVRAGVPAIAIDKSGPTIATAGETLHFTMLVSNPGTVPFPAGQVKVTDAGCDDAPELAGKSDGSGDDGSPGTLDPGDAWTYTCSRRTDDPGGDCQLSVVHNTATASGSVGAITDTATSAIETTLLCPDIPPPDPPNPEPPNPEPPNPEPPLPPQPSPVQPLTPVVPGQVQEPGAVRPAGARPPLAGAAGVAGLQSSKLARCVARVPRIRLRGARVSRVRVFLDGHLVRRVSTGPLQRRVAITRLGRVGAGPHRMTARVTFRLGSGTRPLILVRRFRICAAALPRFTG